MKAPDKPQFTFLPSPQPAFVGLIPRGRIRQNSSFLASPSAIYVVRLCM